MDAGATGTVVWDLPTTDLDLAVSTSYIIRVTASTGFYYEFTGVSPSS
jgi:hypothetical protein